MPRPDFADHFSTLSGRYSEYRPCYPAALFEFLAAAAPARTRAWDCGTGNGQAAADLAAHFTQVIATDPSHSQIRHARPDARIRYHVATAEQSGLAPESVDLVTAAQAAHWFDLDRFYGEVRRVLRPGGVIALWSYALACIDPDVDRVIRRLYDGIVKDYWPPERALVENGYRNIPFPFERIAAPGFDMQADWTAVQLLNYIRTWSAVRYCAEHTGSDPVMQIEAELLAHWGNPAEPRRIHWPLALRVGRAVLPT